MVPSDVLAVLHRAATEIRTALDGLAEWRPAGTVDGQYTHDLVADAAGIAVLEAAGFAVVSEESGDHPGELTVVLDPVDGSTNASRGIPWYSTSLCAVDGEGMQVALVVDQVHALRYAAIRGGGATRNGVAIAPSSCASVRDAVLGLNGYPRRHLGWKQYRALGSAALDLCAVASGILDGFVDCTSGGLAPWDYLGGALVCREAGAIVTGADGKDIVATGFEDRRVIVAAGTPALHAELLAARRWD